MPRPPLPRLARPRCGMTCLHCSSLHMPLRCLSSTPHKIVIPPLLSREGHTTTTAAPSSSSHTRAGLSEYAQHRRVSPEVATFLPTDSAAELHRAHAVDSVDQANASLLEGAWRDSKSHMRRQQKLVDEYGVEGAVRETLQPSHTSFREMLRQRPLDRVILQEIYMGLHGRRIERKLKRGVSWEHWITKGDATAPVFNTSSKAQQTFAFGRHIQQVRCATHPQQFPIALAHAPTSGGGVAETKRVPGTADSKVQGRKQKRGRGRPDAKTMHNRVDLLPEVAVIGRTSSGKSSLINAIVNAMVTPYGHLRGTTDAVRFYNVASRLFIVDCPGYGFYDPLCTPAIDAENAVKAMRAYLACGAAPGAFDRRHRTHRQTGSSRTAGRAPSWEGKQGEEPVDDDRADDSSAEGEERREDASRPLTARTPRKPSADPQGRTAMLYQPRNLKRVLVCVSAHGMQHLDYAYCDLLESYQIPFSVVLTKTDAAPIRQLARLTDHTRSRLVHYTQCKEILLTSALRMAGIDKVQELLGSFAAADDPLHGATVDFSSIV